MLLAAILHKVTGKEVSKLAQDDLFRPLGIKNAEWDKKALVRRRCACAHETSRSSGNSF